MSDTKIPFAADGSIIGYLPSDTGAVHHWEDPSPFVGHLRFGSLEESVCGGFARVVWKDDLQRVYKTPLRFYPEIVPWMTQGIARLWWMPVRKGRFTYVRKATYAEITRYESM